MGLQDVSYGDRLITEKEVSSMMSLKLWGEVLSIHHKNGKKECAPNDVATLCKSCHTKEEAKLRKKAV